MIDTSNWPDPCTTCGKLHFKLKVCPKIRRTDWKQPAKKRAYDAVHKWAERHLVRKGYCFYCEKPGKTQWSNIDHKYRRDPSEWQEVCISCHYNFDVTMNNMKPLPKRQKKVVS